jgi:hypothetical protein
VPTPSPTPLPVCKHERCVVMRTVTNDLRVVVKPDSDFCTNIPTNSCYVENMLTLDVATKTNNFINTTDLTQVRTESYSRTA